MLFPYRRAALLFSATLLALVLPACAGTAGDTASDAGSPAAAFNQADVAFLQNMVPHHEQAVEMAELVEGRTDRAELLQLAESIVATQSAEIDQMNGLLAAAEEDPTIPEGMDHSGAGHGNSAPGMMDDADMAEIEGLQGQAFDLAFLDLMSEHHQGAIDMADEVTTAGENPDVARLAAEVIQAQQAEIEQMAQWRAEWAG
jgi:uncharacterized protein (DUF305 family)